MQKIALVLAFLACASHGRRLQVPAEMQSDSLKSLSSLLLANDAAEAFNPSSPGARLSTRSPSAVSSPLHHYTPVRSTNGALAAIQEQREAGPLRRMLSSKLVKRSAAVAGALAAASLLLPGAALAMKAGASMPLAAMFSPAATWSAYETALATNPLLVKALTSLVGFTAGDILAQTLVEKVDKYDPMRTVRLGGFGLLWHGPSSHYFYGFLDNLIPGTDLTTVFTKVFCDQVLWNPIFGTVFFTYLTFAEGKTFADLKKKLQQDLFTAVKGSWAFWMPAHFVNFKFIPGDQRVLYINCLQILYNIFLSIIGNRKVADAPAPAPAPAPAA